MMPWSRCNCWSRRESGRAITVTSWPARASRYANVLPILPAPMTAIDKGDLAAGAIFFRTDSPLIRFHPPSVAPRPPPSARTRYAARRILVGDEKMDHEWSESDDLLGRIDAVL